MGSEDSLQKSLLSSHRADPRDPPQVIRLAGGAFICWAASLALLVVCCKVYKYTELIKTLKQRTKSYSMLGTQQLSRALSSILSNAEQNSQDPEALHPKEKGNQWVAHTRADSPTLLTWTPSMKDKAASYLSKQKHRLPTNKWRTAVAASVDRFFSPSHADSV